MEGAPYDRSKIIDAENEEEDNGVDRVVEVVVDSVGRLQFFAASLVPVRARASMLADAPIAPRLHAYTRQSSRAGIAASATYEV